MAKTKMAKTGTRIKNGVKLLLYLGLFLAGFAIVRDDIHEYFAGKTRFHTQKVPFAYLDVPTLTMCFEHQSLLSFLNDYDVIIPTNGTVNSQLDLQIFSNHTMVQGENTFEMKVRGVERNLSVVFTELSVRQLKAGLVNRHCIKISPTLREFEQAYGTLIVMAIFKNGKVPSGDAFLYFTTEANAYGAAASRWLDGKVYPFSLKPGMFHGIAIEDITEFEYLRPACSEVSFFQCLSSKLRSSQTCTDYGMPCSPNLTLPTDERFIDLPACNTTEAINCYWKLLTGYYFDPNVCKGGGQRACQIKEYTTGEWTPPIQPEGLNGYGFLYRHETSKSSRGERFTLPYKTLKKEEYIWTGAKYFGTVGGSIGLMIGFSFLALANWAIDRFFMVLETGRLKKLVP